jgi:hypothetical protein
MSRVAPFACLFGRCSARFASVNQLRAHLRDDHSLSTRAPARSVHADD